MWNIFYIIFCWGVVGREKREREKMGVCFFLVERWMCKFLVYSRRSEVLLDGYGNRGVYGGGTRKGRIDMLLL